MKKKHSSFFYIFFIAIFFLYLPTALAETDIQRLNFQVEIPPVFIVYADKAKSQAVLGPARLGNSPASTTIPIVVISNTDENYRIYLTLEAPPANQMGDNLPQDELEFMISNGQAGGTSNQSSFAPLNPGRQLIFSSSRGAEDRFYLIIRNKNERILDAGFYYGRISLDVDRS